MLPPLDAGAAAALLCEDFLGALGGEAVLAVDATSELEVPLLLPAVVVAVARGREPSTPPYWADVALTPAPFPPRPWVGVADVDTELRDLSARAASTPVAAVTLAQVLRAGQPGDVERDLAVESLAYSTLQAGPEFSAWSKNHVGRAERLQEGGPVLAARRGNRVTITLNRPEVHNAYSAAMRDALCRALSDARGSDVEIRGAGPSFCSGGDLDEFGTAPDPATAHLVRTARSAARLMLAVSQRTTVFLHGACAGAGIELPAFARRVVAADDTRIWLPEVAMGLIPGAGGTASLPRRIGRHRTAWMALSGRRLDARTALEWGLVDEVS